MKKQLTREEIVELVYEELKAKIKELLERLMKEERELYLKEEKDTKGNGYYERSLLTKFGEIEGLRVPRTRDGGFYPALLPGKTRSWFDLGEMVMYMFLSGISTRKVSKFLEKIYQVYYSPTSISRLCEVAEEEIEKWRGRVLERSYLALYIDCFFLPVRRGRVKKEPIYVVIGLREGGKREVIGFWVMGGEGESSYVWEEILREIRDRGVEEVEMVVADGLSGIEEAIRRVFPGARYQYCIVHATRNSMKKVRKEDKEELAQVLKGIYRAENREEARDELRELEARFGRKYPKVVKFWKEKFDVLLTFMDYPEWLRRYIYTTNWLERLIKELRRRLKIMESLPGERSVEKILYLLLREENEKYLSRTLPGFKKYSWKEESSLQNQTQII